MYFVIVLSVVDCCNGLINVVDLVESERFIVLESRYFVIVVYV